MILETFQACLVIANVIDEETQWYVSEAWHTLEQVSEEIIPEILFPKLFYGVSWTSFKFRKKLLAKFYFQSFFYGVSCTFPK